MNICAVDKLHLPIFLLYLLAGANNQHHMNRTITVNLQCVNGLSRAWTVLACWPQDWHVRGQTRVFQSNFPLVPQDHGVPASSG